MAGQTGLRLRMRRLYRGETTYPFIEHRRRWYYGSAAVLVICVLSLATRGFNLGIEFKGGTQYSIPATGTSLTIQQVRESFTKEKVEVQSVQNVGNSSSRQFIVKAPSITRTVDDQQKLRAAIESDLKLNPQSISQESVSSTWGSDISRKALQGLVFFLIVVSIYISIRFQWRMAVAAIVALLHDLLLTAGVYSIIGFEVTPSTVVGLLTILGFSLYDTVVIFDKVGENTKDLTAGSRMTFSQGTNLAVNQTLMRSINTSLISLLPVAGLLFIGAFLLGVGTIKDLALVMFVGLATGAYSSLFLAAPFVVDLTERQPAYKALTKRVVAKRASEAARHSDSGRSLVPAGVRSGAPAPAPRPGARRQQPSSPVPAPNAVESRAGTPAEPRKPGAKPTANRAAGSGTGKPTVNRAKPVPKRKR